MDENALGSGSADWWASKEAKGILTPAEYAKKLLPLLTPLGMKIVIEPGRFIAGNAGVLVTRVEYVKKTKHKNFAIVDAAMNDMLRPALYQAGLDIETVSDNTKASTGVYDIVGPVCETGDFIGKQRSLAIAEGELLSLALIQI